MNAIVTGGAGFVGSHIVAALLRDGHAVTVIDDLSTGDLSNISDALTNDRCSFIQGDVCNGLPPNLPADVIFHFASPASPLDYAKHPIATMRVNALGTELCCAYAAERGARLIFASTSEVYGDPLEHPQREEYFGNVNPNGPRACYDEAKRYGEAMVMTYRRLYGMDARIVRIFNTYGPRMRICDGRAVPAFVSQALDGEPFTIFGEGTQTRSLCYVDDLVEGIVRFASLDSPRHRIVNLGSDREVTVMEIATLIAREMNVPLRTVHQPLPENDPLVRRPDLTRARETLDWDPATSLEQGLRATIAWFRAAVPA